MTLSNTSALILIDLQQGFENHDHWGGNRNNPQLEANVAKLLKHWRSNKRPIAHVQHASTDPNSPLHPDKPGFSLILELAPEGDEPVFVKNVNSAFIGTELQTWLDQNKIQSLVFVGLTTNHCVSTSARMAANLGYQTTVVADGVATFARQSFDGQHFSAQQVHDIALASLHQEFAQIITTDEALTD